jgi:magnesium transporter
MTRAELAQPMNELTELAAQGDRAGLSALFREMPGSEVSLALSRLDSELQVRLLRLLDSDDAAELVGMLEGSQAAELMESLSPGDAAAILERLPSNDEADLLGQLEEDKADAILAQLDTEKAGKLQALSSYPPETAGGLMVTEYLAYQVQATVRDVTRDLRDNAGRYATYHVQYVYVLDPEGRLTAVVRVRDLLLSSPETRLKDLTPIQPTMINHLTDLDALREIFGRVPYVGLPVVDDDQVLVGVVRRAHVEEALTDRTAGELRQALGIVGGEEIRTMPLLRRSGRRLSWLSVNIVLNIIAASVIVLYEDTLARVIALAVFLPIISDMSGCSGNQAVAVSLRELSLGLVRTTEVVRVWLKEVAVGAINGLVLGLLLGAVAWLWKGNLYLGIVVGAAMTVNTMVAVSIGGTIPLVLRRLRLDPALASGPILTTVTDMCGFFLALALATVMLSRLG